MKLKALPIAALLALTLTLTSCGDPGKFSDSEIISKEQKRDTDTAVTYNYADVNGSAAISFGKRIVSGFAQGDSSEL